MAVSKAAETADRVPTPAGDPEASHHGVPPQAPEFDSPVVDVSCEDLQRALRVLQCVVEDRGELLKLPYAEQMAFLEAAGKVAHPGRAAKRALVRAARRQRRQERAGRVQADEQSLDQVGMRNSVSSARRLGATPEPVEEPAPQFDGQVRTIAKLQVARNCYICKQDYSDVHHFYDSMCPACGEFNWLKRHQTADLSGRHALLTGGRVKIGFETALKLLRAGASCVVTTRFPHDAASRFAAQADAADWLGRLEIYGLDMRHTPSVEGLAQHLLSTLPKLDFILNNACQTVRRPPGYYEHLLEDERRLADELPEALHGLVAAYHQLVERRALPGWHAPAGSSAAEALLPTGSRSEVAGAVKLLSSAELSQLRLAEEDDTGREYFPEGVYDSDLQQVDLRDVNSWRLKLAEVSTVELLEVQLVNAIAPYILNARLKPLMERVDTADKHIVNVSAMEGVFYRAFKRDTHPHTNMAKAALNMMTRTSAADYVRSGIHMNSVDTGWITDEDPHEITQRKRREHRFRTPLDSIDAAARICDPVFAGLNTGVHLWGKFLKDYRVSKW